jgi:phage baseplate assembly protein W
VDDVFGQDIKLGEDGQALVAASGELLLTSGAETGVQDIGLRLGTPLGELFYDVDFGSLIHEWFRDEDSQARRGEFEAEVEQRVDEDPRVVLGSPVCKVIAFDEEGFTATLHWEFIGEDQPFNLVISYGGDTDKKELVIKDVNPRSGL